MAAEQKNFENFKYTDDNTVDWTKRGEKDAIRNAVDGSSATSSAPTWNDSARMKVRRAIYQDPTTFRTKSIIVYTPTAFAALALGDTLDFMVEGETSAVTYTLVKKIAEKQPARGTSRKLADHA